jgi:hypothetical protein
MTVKTLESMQELLERARGYDVQRSEKRAKRKEGIRNFGGSIQYSGRIFKNQGTVGATNVAGATVQIPLVNFDPDDIILGEELARRLKVEVGWIKEKARMRNKNKIPSFKMGRYTRYHWPTVCQWLTNQAAQGVKA